MIADIAIWALITALAYTAVSLCFGSKRWWDR